MAEDAKTTPYTELSRDDMGWAVLDSTFVETQTFYLTADNGNFALIQIIHSNVMYVHKDKDLCRCRPLNILERL